MKVFKRFTALLAAVVFVIVLLQGCSGVRQTQVTRLIGVSLANLTDEWRIVLKN